ncbi:MAG: hypothetical protein ACOYL1_04645 [Chlamydiia bacterium]|jgi:hypothetical protein
MIQLILCVFSEFFCTDPDLKTIRSLNKEVIGEYKEIADRGCGIREGIYYLQFQSNTSLTKKEGKLLAGRLYQFLEKKRVQLARPLEALLLFKNSSDGEFYQIDLQNDLFDCNLLP